LLSLAGEPLPLFPYAFINRSRGKMPEKKWSRFRLPWDGAAFPALGYAKWG